MPIEPGNFSLGVLVGGLIVTVASHYLTKSRNAEERRFKLLNDTSENIRSACFNHQLASSRNLESIRITEFNKAAAAFYTAFLDEIIYLEDTDPKDVPIDFLIQAKTATKQGTADMQHRKAMIMFKPYINKSVLAGFEAAWSAYYDKKNKGNEYDFKFHLNNLLEYAKPK